MKSAKFGFIIIIFWTSFLMWMGFANGILNGMHPITGTTSNGPNIIEVILDTIFYFGPHLSISLFLMFLYKNENIEFGDGKS